MDMLYVAKPLFNAEMETEAYYFSFNYGNVIVESAKQSKVFDNAVNSPFLELVNETGLDALTGGRPIFIPVTQILLMTALENVCQAERDKIVFIIDKTCALDAATLQRISYFHELGFKIALRRDDVTNAAAVLPLCSFAFLDTVETRDYINNQNFLRNSFKNVKVVASGLASVEKFDMVKNSYAKLFDGAFYKAHSGFHGASNLAPMKIHYVQLLNIIGQEDFDFGPFARVVQQDPALAVKFLKLVNSSRKLTHKITSLAQAAAMLGQIEVRKWITTAVSSEMNADRPSEIARVSLIRAKFCENMARHFEMASQAENLFLMGLFSVLDVMLEMPMADALKYVFVPDKIREAILSGQGQYGEVYEMMQSYDTGDWFEVSRLALLKNLQVRDIGGSYTGALHWLRDFLYEADALSAEDIKEAEAAAHVKKG